MLRRALLITLAVLPLALIAGGCGDSATTNVVAAKDQPNKSRSAEVQPEAISAAEQNAALARFAAKHRPVYCGGRKRPWVAFTFDDGPGPYTKKAVKILRHHRVPATFFLVGRNVAPFKSSLKADQRVGPLGDHSWSHPYLKGMPASAADQEITSAASAIRRASGERVRMFRPPYGAHNTAVDRVARREKMVQVLWNVDSEDALGADHAQISRNVIKGLTPGSIILMHENRGQTIRALKYKILPHLKRRKIELVTVPQMLAGNPPTAKQLARGRKGCR